MITLMRILLRTQKGLEEGCDSSPHNRMKNVSRIRADRFESPTAWSRRCRLNGCYGVAAYAAGDDCGFPASGSLAAWQALGHSPGQFWAVLRGPGHRAGHRAGHRTGHLHPPYRSTSDDAGYGGGHRCKAGHESVGKQLNRPAGE